MPIHNDTLQMLQDKLWHVIKHEKNNNISNYKSRFEYVLRKNDIIKLGRIKFLIRDLNIVNGFYETTVETFKLVEEYKYIFFNIVRRILMLRQLVNFVLSVRQKKVTH
jgi:hypothetical protein